MGFHWCFDPMARLERDADGRLVARADTGVTDETMFALIDAARR